MNNYQKIATIIIRVAGLTFVLSAVLEIGIVVTGILLISLDLMPREVLVHEMYFVQAAFSLIGGLILFARSKSFANYIIEGLQDSKDTAPQD